MLDPFDKCLTRRLLTALSFGLTLALSSCNFENGHLMADDPCSAGNIRHSDESVRLSECEYEVLSTLFGSEAKLVIRSEPVDDYHGQLPSSLTESIAGLSVETISSYNFNNKSPVPISCEFMKGIPCVTLSKEDTTARWDFSKESATEKWRNFRAEYQADAYHSAYRAGFNSDRTQAVVWATETCGSLCFSGYIYLLVQEGRDWKISHRRLTSVS